MEVLNCWLPYTADSAAAYSQFHTETLYCLCLVLTILGGLERGQEGEDGMETLQIT